MFTFRLCALKGNVMKKANKILFVINIVLTLVLVVAFVYIVINDVRIKRENEALREQFKLMETKAPVNHEVITKAPQATIMPSATIEPTQTPTAEPTIEPTQTPTPTQTKEPNSGTKEPEKTKQPAVTLRPNYTKVPIKTQEPDGAITLVFAGDILLSESMTNTYSKNNGGGIRNVLSYKLVNEFVNADVAMVNQEFPFSTRGTKMANKQYTFRTNPKYVSVFTDMGIDIVSLANNHTLGGSRRRYVAGASSGKAD